MIKLINNEFIKVKKIRILFTYILLIISLIIMDKYSDKNILDLSYNLIPFIGIITSIIYGGIINGEIDKGTFRYYLTKPYKRWKIYASKMISIIIYIVLSILIVCFTSLIINNGFERSDSLHDLSLFQFCFADGVNSHLSLTCLYINSALSSGKALIVIM